MSQSELILKTYREIVSQLDQSYYILECISGENKILYSSSCMQKITGLSQFDLARDSKLLFDSIHPNYLKSYIDGNRELLKNHGNLKRKYLIKNQQTGVFIPIEEIATSRLNKEKNCFEIYCSIKNITDQIEDNELQHIDGEISPILFKSYVDKNKTLIKLAELTACFLDALQLNYDMNGCRFYAFDANTGKLTMLANNENKKHPQKIKEIVEMQTKSYEEDSYFYEIIKQNKPFITDDKSEIVKILKSYTGNPLLNQFAGIVVKTFNLKSFGILPINCPSGKTVGVVTFGSKKAYNDIEKKLIIEFTNTTAILLTSLLEALTEE